MRFPALLALAVLPLTPLTFARADSKFNFEGVTTGAVLPLAVQNNGLTASFSGGGAVCLATGLSGALFTALTGQALIQGLCDNSNAVPLTVAFSKPLTRLSFALAINGSATAPVTLTYKLRGTTVATKTVSPTVPTTSLSPEISVSYSGSFDSVVLSSANFLAVDNFDAIPAS